MDVDMGLDKEPNNIDHYTSPTVTTRRSKDYVDTYEGGCINRDDDINETSILNNYKFICFLNNWYNINYYATP